MGKNAVAQFQNLIKSARDLTHASWTTDGTSTVATVSGVDHFGNTSTFSRLTVAGGGAQYVRGNGYTPASKEGIYTMSAWVKTVAGGSQKIRLTPSTIGASSGDLTVTGSWTQVLFTTNEVINAGTCLIKNDAAVEAFDIYIDDIQLVRANRVGPRTNTTGTAVDTGDITNKILASNTIAKQQNLIGDSSTNLAYGVNTGVVKSLNTLDVTDPKGGNTATKFVYDGSGAAAAFRVYIGASALVGKPGVTYTGSIWIRLATGTRPMILNVNTFGPTSFIATTSWQRIPSVALWTALASGIVLDIFDGAGQNAAFTFYVWQPQVVRANWAGPQCPTTGTMIDTGDIVNQIAGAQNLFINSDDFAGASYTKEGVTCPLDATVADPFGGTGMSAMTEDGNNSVHRFSHVTTFTAAEVGKIVAISAWIKKGTENVANMAVAGLAASDFNVNTGVATPGSGVLRAIIKAQPNGTYRCTNVFLVTAAMVGFKAYINARQAALYQGTNGNKALYIIGMQKAYANRAGDRALTTSAVYNIGDIANDVI